MKGSSIFYVATPLALMNAQEAVYQLDLDRAKTHLIYFANSHEISVNIRGKMAAVIDESLWGKIDCVFLKITGRFANYERLYRAWRFTRRQQPVDNFFTTHNGSWLSYFLRDKIKHKNLILFDDGTATLLYERHKVHNERKTMINKLLRLNQSFSYSLFTAFNIDRNENHKEIIQNDYSYLKRNAEQNKLSNVALIYGQPLAKLNFLPKEDYFKAIRDYVATLQDKVEKVYYASHYFEDSVDVEELLNELNLELWDSKSPPEWEFIQKGAKVPKVIVSFISTSLFTLPKIFDVGVEFSAIDVSRRICDSKKADFSFLYQKLEQAGINIYKYQP